MSKRKALSRAEQWKQLEEEEADKKEKDKDKDYEVEEVSELEEEFQPTGEVAESPASLQTLKDEAYHSKACHPCHPYSSEHSYPYSSYHSYPIKGWAYL